MTILRQFIIAPSLVRLIRKERGGERVLEGYFPDQPQRGTYVQVEETGSSLIHEASEGVAPDEQADLPLAHAQALLAVSHGQVEYTCGPSCPSAYTRSRLFTSSGPLL
jgi:hypothetical protein